MSITSTSTSVRCARSTSPRSRRRCAEAGVWSVMGAYNRLHGSSASEHPRLLGRDPEGRVGLRRRGRIRLVRHAQHRRRRRPPGSTSRCRGPASWFGAHLADAVEGGRGGRGGLDEHVRRDPATGRAHGRAGQRRDGGRGARTTIPSVGRSPGSWRSAAPCCSTNDGLLPLDPATVRGVAVIGPNAISLATGGGGSSQVRPTAGMSLVDELRTRLDGVDVTYEIGCRLDRGAGRLDPRLIPAGLALECFRGTSWEGDPAGYGACRTSARGLAHRPTRTPTSRSPTARCGRAATCVPMRPARGRSGSPASAVARLFVDGRAGDRQHGSRPPATSSTEWGARRCTAESNSSPVSEHEVLVEYASGMPRAGSPASRCSPAARPTPMRCSGLSPSPGTPMP